MKIYYLSSFIQYRWHRFVSIGNGRLKRVVSPSHFSLSHLIIQYTSYINDHLKGKRKNCIREWKKRIFESETIETFQLISFWSIFSVQLTVSEKPMETNMLSIAVLLWKDSDKKNTRFLPFFCFIRSIFAHFINVRHIQSMRICNIEHVSAPFTRNALNRKYEWKRFD